MIEFDLRRQIYPIPSLNHVDMHFPCVLSGANRLARNIRQMTGSYPNIYFRFCWYVLSPILITVGIYELTSLVYYLKEINLFKYVWKMNMVKTRSGIRLVSIMLRVRFVTLILYS